MAASGDNSWRRGAAVLVRLRSGLDTLTLAISSALLAGFTLAVIYVVASRYVFGRTPDWAEELPRLLLVWSVFIGLVPVTLRSSHLATGLSLFGTAVARLLTRLLVSLFFAVLACAGLQLAISGLDDLTTAMQIPFALTYAAVPIGCGLAAIGNLLPRDAA